MEILALECYKKKILYTWRTNAISNKKRLSILQNEVYNTILLRNPFVFWKRLHSFNITKKELSKLRTIKTLKVRTIYI